MSFAVTELEFVARLQRPDPALRYLGPTIRGLLGHALKDLACQMSHRDCGRCILHDACPYPQIFDGRVPGPRTVLTRIAEAPQPFVLRVAGPGEWWGAADELRWGLNLFGESAAYAPYLIEALQRAGTLGVGPKRTEYTLESVRHGPSGDVLWQRGDEQLRGPIATRSATMAASPSSVLRWRFETPVHIRSHGRFGGLPEPLDLVIAGRRRWLLLSSLYGVAQDPPPRRVDPGEFRLLSHACRTWRISRYSGRQQRQVPLEGMVGELVIEGPWHAEGPWLAAVMTTHLGKYGSFGLGRVAWEAA